MAASSLNFHKITALCKLYWGSDKSRHPELEEERGVGEGILGAPQEGFWGEQGDGACRGGGVKSTSQLDRCYSSSEEKQAANAGE